MYILVLKWGLLWVGRVAYMMVGLGIVVPVLFAMAVDFYIIQFTLDHPGPVLATRVIAPLTGRLLFPGAVARQLLGVYISSPNF